MTPYQPREVAGRVGRALDDMPVVVLTGLRQAGKSMASIAETLNAMKVPTSRGGQWTAMQIKRVIDRLVIREEAKP